MKTDNEDEVEFLIKCRMRKRWVPHFQSMLKYMQYLGEIGSSREVTLFSDGDGDFRPKFKFNLEVEKVDPISGEESGEHYYDAG
mgnify:CR=1 FL=1|tara:strand:+ start:25101 stop:25352 length:252 start_codon:yes stop_codon:yes gene_type:complete